MMNRLLLLACIFALLPASLHADEAPDSSDPEIERRSFKVAEGFEVNLWAADPMIAKPIQMNWDAQGRLWVASSTQYPQIKPGEAPADQVIVLEDTDNDGAADKSSVFADGLLIPTGLEPGDGGVYVANSSELLHLKDTDNDGKADQRRIVLAGFGTEDTHHLIHTFHWGPDGRLYMNQSLYIHSHVETPHGVRRLSAGGIWRFRPESVEFDVYARGMINTWGHAHDQWGQSFATDGAGDGGIYYVFPGAAFHHAEGYERVLYGMNPGSPKYCGLEIVSGRHLPDDWQGNAITNDFRANRVVRFQIDDENGTYVSRPMPDVITSTDVAFRPIDVKMGPDGAIYVADWYNPIINHGEVDFRDPRRDKTRGRIWRITAKGRPLVAKPKLVGVPVADVLEHLKSPEGWARRQAKLVLRSLGSEQVLPGLQQWIAKLDANDPLHERHRLESLWTHQSLDVPEPTLLGELLESKTPQVRAAATRVIGDWAKRLADPMALLAARVSDDHPRVRLEAIRGLARLATPRSIELAMTALDHPRDQYIDHALWLTAKENEAVWMPALKSGEMDFNGNAAHAGFALQAVKSPEAAALLAKQLGEGRTPPAERKNVLELIAGVGGAEELGVVYDLATTETDDPALRAAALAAVEKSIRQRKIAPTGADRNRLIPLLSAEPEPLRAAAMRLAGAWRLSEARPVLTQAAAATETSSSVREAAIAALAEYGPQQADFIRTLDADERPHNVRVMAIIALSAIDLNDAAARAAKLLAQAPEQHDPAPLLAGLLRRGGGGRALASALASERLSNAAATRALRHVEGAGRDERELLQRLRDAAGISATGAKILSPQEMAQRVEQVKRYGDAARGEAIFRRADTSCFKCHAINGAGGQLGPDLGSIGATAPIDYLIDSLLDPNKAIKDGYQSVIVATTDGDVHSGIKMSQTDTHMILRDALRDRIELPLETVRSERPGASLMPTGLIDALPSWEFLNLVRFMSELGKPGPFQSDPGAAGLLVRRWRILSAKAAKRLIADSSALHSAERAARLPWMPAYSLVSGVLPPNAMAADGQQIAFARAEINVATPGRIGLHIGQTRGLSLWVDDAPAEVQPEMELELARGIHTLTFRIDMGERGEGLRVEVRDVPGSGAHAQPVGGR